MDPDVQIHRTFETRLHALDRTASPRRLPTADGSRFPAEVNQYYPVMIAQLLYGDRNLQLQRAELINPRPGPG